MTTLTREGWHVEAEGRVYRRPGTMSLRVSSGIDWFDLEAEVDFEGQRVALPRLLQALRRGEPGVVLDDGSLGMLPEEWLRRHAPLARFGEAEGDALRFRRSQVGLLDALLASQPEVETDAAFEKAREALRRFEGIRPLEAPRGFTGRLRDYQALGLGWMAFLRDFGFGGCLADDMGLGKTVQVLALLEARRRETKKPSLVVVPRSLVFNWKEEAARFAPRLRVRDHTGLDRAREAGAFDDCDVVLTTYGTLRRDAALLKDVAFDYVILDEAQAIKNKGTESAKAARLLGADHRLALSGTPVENHLGELQSLFEFLNPGLLGRVPLARGGTELDEEGRVALARGIAPFILRRTKGQVAKDLPPKTEQTLWCDLEPEQKALCDELRDHYRKALLGRVERQGLARSKMHVLEALLRMRQAACHPGLVDPRHSEGPSAKLDALVPRLVEIVEEGHKALVFSQFTSFLALLKPRLRRGRPRLRVPRRQDARSCRAREALRGGRGLRRLPDQPQGGRPRPQPHRRRVRLSPRPLVEPGGGGAGGGPDAPHRPGASRLRLPARRARHGRREGAGPPGEEARARRRDRARRRGRAARPAPRGPGAAAVVACDSRKPQLRPAPLDGTPGG